MQYMYVLKEYKLVVHLSSYNLLYRMLHVCSHDKTYYVVQYFVHKCGRSLQYTR